MLIGLDLDGTLLDSRLRHLVALQQAAKSFAVSLSEHNAQTYFKLKCDGYSGIDALRLLGIPLAESLIRRWTEIIETEEMLALDRLYPDTLQALKLQRERKDEFVLVTGRQDQAAARWQIAKLGLNAFLCDIKVVDPRDRSQSKAEASRPYDITTVVGDTEIDLEWAADLGARFHASSYGFRSERYWHHRRVKNHANLSEIFDEINLRDSPVSPVF